MSFSALLSMSPVQLYTASLTEYGQKLIVWHLPNNISKGDQYLDQYLLFPDLPNTATVVL